MNVFEAVKQAVPTRDAAQTYGIKVNRNGMARCPFHNDRNPSMKLYHHRFHCFGCQADGDVIDFTARLYGLSPKEAAEKLASDFGVSYDSKGRASPKAVKQKTKIPEELQFYQAVERCFRAYADYLHLLKQWKVEYAPHSPEEEWHPLFVEALQKQSCVEYLLDTLLFGTLEEQARALAGKGKEVPAIEQRISEFTAGSPGSRAESSRGDAA